MRDIWQCSGGCLCVRFSAKSPSTILFSLITSNNGWNSDTAKNSRKYTTKRGRNRESSLGQIMCEQSTWTRKLSMKRVCLPNASVTNFQFYEPMLPRHTEKYDAGETPNAQHTPVTTTIYFSFLNHSTSVVLIEIIVSLLLLFQRLSSNRTSDTDLFISENQ